MSPAIDAEDPLDVIDWCLSHVDTAADMALSEAHSITEPAEHGVRDRMVFLASSITCLVEKARQASEAVREVRT